MHYIAHDLQHLTLNAVIPAHFATRGPPAWMHNEPDVRKLEICLPESENKQHARPSHCRVPG